MNTKQPSRKHQKRILIYCQSLLNNKKLDDQVLYFIEGFTVSEYNFSRRHSGTVTPAVIMLIQGSLR